MDAMMEERVKPAWVTVVLLSCSSLEQHCISGELSLLRSLWCPHLEVFLCIMVRYMEELKLPMMKMTPRLFYLHWNLAVHVTAMLLVEIKLVLAQVVANQFHKSFPQSKVLGL